MANNFWNLLALISGLLCIMFSLVSMLGDRYDKATYYVCMAVLIKLTFPDRPQD